MMITTKLEGVPREFYGYQGAWIPLSWDEPSFAGQTFVARGKGGKERLVMSHTKCTASGDK